MSPSVLEQSVNKKLETLETDTSELSKAFSENDNMSGSQAVDVLEKIAMPLHKDWGIVKHLMGVKNNDDLRTVHNSLQNKVVESFQSKIRPLCMP